MKTVFKIDNIADLIKLGGKNPNSVIQIRGSSWVKILTNLDTRIKKLEKKL